ncbi:MAG: NAD(+)/NADH kinase [Chloroflexi bacterium]|nr:NAD(+)/NADH kinase [Chloroflexota bacterium]
MKKVGILYKGHLPEAGEMAQRLARELSGGEFWVCAVGEEGKVRAQLPGTSLIISVGGDGTILRSARAVVPWSVPIVGINLGKLGFMAELTAQEALDKLPDFLAGNAHVEERAMLLVELSSRGRTGEELPTFHALNEAAVGRGTVSRVIYVDVAVDGEPLTTYKADGVILATATGSTGYALAAGGPILYPQSRDMLLQPVAPHLSLPHGIVLPSTAVVDMTVRSDHQVLVSIDGQLDITLQNEERVRVRISPYSARFLRARPPAYFYGTLPRRLSGQERRSCYG